MKVIEINYFTSYFANYLRFLLYFLFLIFFTYNISAASIGSTKRGKQELVLQGSEIYDAITAINMESKLWNFSDNTPCTIQELEFYLKEIDRESLSEVGKKCYDYIQNYFYEEEVFSFGTDLLKLTLEPKISLEGYFKTEDDLPWIYDRYQRKPIIDAPLGITCGDYFTIMCDLYFGLNRSEMLEDDCYTSLPLETDSIDVNFPTTAYFSTGHSLKDNAGITFQLGMAQGAIGRTITGSIIKSQYLTGATYALLSAYSKNIKFTTSVQQLNVDRFFYYHKLDIRLFKRLTFSALEGQLAAHSMELRFLNPLTIFHGFSPWRDYSEEEDTHTCAYMALAANWVIFKFTRLYGLFSMTQFQTPYETSNWGNSLTPNGMGGQVGLESYVPLKLAYLHLGGEFYYAQPYLYLKPTQEASMVRAYREDIGDTDRVNYEWVGSPLGPDTVAGVAQVGYEMPGKYKFQLKYLFCEAGELAEDNIFEQWTGSVRDTSDFYDLYGNYSYMWQGYPTTKHDRDQNTPTGRAEYTNAISFLASYHFTNNVEFMMQPSYALVFNANHDHGNTLQSFEIAVAVRVRFMPRILKQTSNNITTNNQVLDEGE